MDNTLALITPYHTHQVLELPPIALDVTHWVWYQGWCPDCGRWSKAQVPAEHATGYGPRCSALMGEVAGTSGNGRRIVQTFCASVLRVPVSVGAFQKVLDRVAQAIEPHSMVIATPVRHAVGNDIDETPWFLARRLQWLWVMVSDTAALYMMHPHRSKEACAALIDDWEGAWSVTATGCTTTGCRRDKPAWHTSSAVHGEWRPVTIPTWRPVGPGPAEVQRLCHMATAPPTGGEWRAWYARLCKVMDQYHDRSNEAGRFARRLLREMDSRWVLLAQHGVEPTNNRAERAGRFGVLWRKRSQGTASTKGNHWVERILSLRETCRLRARSTSTVLVDAVASLCKGQPPDLSWIGQREDTLSYPL